MRHFWIPVIMAIIAGFLCGCLFGCAEKANFTSTWQYPGPSPCEAKLAAGAQYLPSTLGFTVMRTDLGRYDDFSSERARLIQNGQLVHINDELADIPGQVSVQVFAFDGDMPIIMRQWEDPQNGINEAINGNNILTPTSYQTDMYRDSINISAVDGISNFNTGYSLLNDGRILFQALINGVVAPYVMNYDGGNKQPWTSGAADAHPPRVTPDGKHYVYNLSDGLNIDGVDYKTGCAFNFVAGFSPDSSKAIFLCGASDTSPPVYVINIDGTGQKFLTDRGGYIGMVHIIDTYDYHYGSSDLPIFLNNNTVLYTQQLGDTTEFFSVDINALATKQLTQLRATVAHAALSKDFSTVAFTSTVHGYRELFSLDLSSGVVRQLTEGSPGCSTEWARFSN